MTDLFKVFGVCGEAGHGKDLLGDWLCGRFSAVKVSFADPMKRLSRQIFGFPDEALWGSSEARNRTYLWDSQLAMMKAPDAIVRSAKELAPTDDDKRRALVGAFRMWFDWIMAEYAEGRAPSLRTILQLLGTEYGRSVDPNLWISYTHDLVVPAIKAGTGYSPKHGLDLTLPPALGVVIPDHRFVNEIEYTQARDGKVFRIRRLSLVKREVENLNQQHASEAEQRGVPDSAFDHVFELVEGLPEAWATFGQYFSSLEE